MIKYYLDFPFVGSDNKPCNEFSTSEMDNMEFEPLGDIMIDEAKKMEKVNKELKNEEK